MWAKILAWLRKYWLWILFPIGLLVAAAWAYSRFFPQRKTVVVEGSKPDVGAVIAIHDNQTAAKIEEAEKATGVEIKAIEEKHQEVLDQLNDTQRLQYEELKKKPAQEITNWLLKVGRGDA